ncbi:hypothetical protein [Streptomyces sp. FZ201]|uniref:hypothetical protein n=1 Tax=Streptomyces sp. FZ201 TaxID=3057122 RepID=UPI0021C0F4E6|nr:hypothetical protein [Streptomyces sp. FZ201]
MLAKSQAVPPIEWTRMSPSTRKRNCARVAALLTTAVLALGPMAPSASADGRDGLLGLDGSGEGLNINFDIAQTVWTVLVSTALKPLCLNGADSPKDAFIICPVTDEAVDASWGIGGVPNTP